MSSISKESDFLFAAARQGRLAHCVMLVGAAEETCPVAVQLAAVLVCPSGGQPSCTCAVCRHVRSGIHPDVVSLDRGEGLITVDDVRGLRAEVFVAPLEAEKKVFLIHHAGNMNGAAQNAALKLFEEPPAGVFFVLLCENQDAMMETVRSRCMTVVLSRGSGSVLPEETPEVQQLHAAALAQASEFAAALVQEDELALYLACIQWEKLKRPEAAAFFDAALARVRTALLAAQGFPDPHADAALAGLGTVRLYRIAEILLRRRAAVERNVGVAHLMGSISAEYFGG